MRFQGSWTMAADQRRLNQRGMAMIETLPILVIFLILIGHGLGFFGIVHTGILNSIAARSYAFETFRNRTDVSYFRDSGNPEGFESRYNQVGNRFHSITSETSPVDAQLFATTRPLAIGREVATSGANVRDHNERIFEIQGRNRLGGVESSPAWIMVGYGICLNAKCGGD
jgi:hypothetical protein